MTQQEFEKSQIPIIEIFQSISGEGISSGNILTFVRVAGCNLRCRWCDTKYSFPESGASVTMMRPKEILNAVEKLGCSEIICTGGEPLEEGRIKRYLPAYLSTHGFSVHVETSGGSPLYTEQELDEFAVDREELSYCMDIKCPASAMSDKNLFENIELLCEDDELKFVVQDQSDLEYALQIVDTYKDHLAEEDIALNFSPVFGEIDPVVIVEFLKKHLAYFEENELWPRLNLQLHKYVWKPDQRGV